MMAEALKAPFPWFGGKSTVAPIIWARIGPVANYVEPFFGSGAVLLARPEPAGLETINDLDGFVSNFWRAMRADPLAVAEAADWPVNENDLAARHYWLVTEGKVRVEALIGDPLGYDVQVAGWWCWGLCAWIGGGWCAGDGPWQSEDGAWRKRDAGQGVNRKLPHLGDAGRGVNRKRPHLLSAGQGINRVQAPVLEWFLELSTRLRRVRVCSGDWSRVCGPSVTFKNGLTGVFLDPPYADTAGRTENLYAADSLNVAHQVREWAIENSMNPLMRICLAGYSGEHEMPGNWECVEWKTAGGYSRQGEGRGRDNSSRERLWFSPYCVNVECDQLCLL